MVAVNGVDLPPVVRLAALAVTRLANFYNAAIRIGVALQPAGLVFLGLGFRSWCAITRRAVTSTILHYLKNVFALVGYGKCLVAN